MSVESSAQAYHPEDEEAPSGSKISEAILMLRSALFGFLATITFLCVVAIVGLPLATGGHAVNILTPSMTPVLNPGDLAFVRKTDPTRLSIGDIIQVQTESNKKGGYTHRIVGLTPVDPTKKGQIIITRGDANNVSDTPIRNEQVIGKLVTLPGSDKPFAIRYVGYLQQHPGVAYGIVGVCLLYAAWQLFGPSSREAKEEDAKETSVTDIS